MQRHAILEDGRQDQLFELEVKEFDQGDSYSIGEYSANPAMRIGLLVILLAACLMGGGYVLRNRFPARYEQGPLATITDYLTSNPLWIVIPAIVIVLIITWIVKGSSKELPGLHFDPAKQTVRQGTFSRSHLVSTQREFSFDSLKTVEILKNRERTTVTRGSIQGSGTTQVRNRYQLNLRIDGEGFALWLAVCSSSDESKVSGIAERIHQITGCPVRTTTVRQENYNAGAIIDHVAIDENAQIVYDRRVRSLNEEAWTAISRIHADLAAHFLDQYPLRKAVCGLRYLFASKDSLAEQGTHPALFFVENTWKHEDELYEVVRQLIKTEAVAPSVVTAFRQLDQLTADMTVQKFIERLDAAQ